MMKIGRREMMHEVFFPQFNSSLLCDICISFFCENNFELILNWQYLPGGIFFLLDVEGGLLLHHCHFLMKNYSIFS